MVSTDPVSIKNITVLPLIVAASDRETLGLTILVLNTLILVALVTSLGVRAILPRDPSFPDLPTS